MQWHTSTQITVLSHIGFHGKWLYLNKVFWHKTILSLIFWKCCNELTKLHWLGSMFSPCQLMSSHEVVHCITSTVALLMSNSGLSLPAGSPAESGLNVKQGIRNRICTTWTVSQLVPWAYHGLHTYRAHQHKLKLIASLYLRVRGGGEIERARFTVICHCLITGPHEAGREGRGGGDNAIINK